jgi:hypothetical protein
MLKTFVVAAIALLPMQAAAQVPTELAGCTVLVRSAIHYAAAGCPGDRPACIVPFGVSPVPGTAPTVASPPPPPTAPARDRDRDRDRPRNRDRDRDRTSGRQCHPAYSGCLDLNAEDLDCADIGDRQLTVYDVNVDPYHLDARGPGNGITCDDIG